MFLGVLTTPTLFYGLLEIKEHNTFKTKKDAFFVFLFIATLIIRACSNLFSDFHLLLELWHYIEIEHHPQIEDINFNSCFC